MVLGADTRESSHPLPILLHTKSPGRPQFLPVLIILLILTAESLTSCPCSADQLVNVVLQAMDRILPEQLSFSFLSLIQCSDATLSFQTLPPTAGDKWDLQKTGDRKIAAFILTAFWQTMHKTFLSKRVSLTIWVEDVLLAKWCIRGVAK